MTEITAAGYLCYGRKSMLFYGAGNTATSAWADAVFVLRDAGIEVFADREETTASDSAVPEWDLCTISATAAMIRHVRAGGQRGHFIDGVACTESDLRKVECSIDMQLAATAVVVPVLSTRSPEKIAKMKARWYRDPCYDIEKTEGCEAHYDELLAYRLESERKWHLDIQHDERNRRLDRVAKSSGLGCSLVLLDYIERLEKRTQRLEYEVHEVKSNAYWADN